MLNGGLARSGIISPGLYVANAGAGERKLGKRKSFKADGI